MSLTSGDAGNSRVGSDHVNWVCKYVVVKVNLINQALLNLILSGNVQSPLLRFFVRDRTTGSETEITRAVTNVTVRQNKRGSKASWTATFKPERISPTFTDLWLTDLSADFNKFVVIRAGYIFEGVEVLVPILTGVKLDRLPYYGRESSSIVLNGFDFGELVEGVPGVHSGYTQAKDLMIFLLNQAGVTSMDFTGFTDFSISGIEFNNNNALEIFERLSNFYGEFTWYFDGDGTFVARDLPVDTTPKYLIQNNTLFEPSSNARDKITEVVVTGNGSVVTRRTDSADRQKYGGIRRVNLQNSIILSEAEAIIAADNLINESRKDRGGFSTSFNPFLFIDDIVTLNHEENSGNRDYRITGWTHSFSASETSINAHSRYSAESVDYEAPTIGTVI